MNWCSRAKPQPSLTDSQQCERMGGLHSLGRGKGHSFSLLLQGTCFTGVYCSSSSSLPLELFALLQDQPLFPNSHTRTQIIVIIMMMNNYKPHMRQLALRP